MTNIGRVDHAVLQLRAQLQRLARERAGKGEGGARALPRPLDRLREARSADAPGDEEFRKSFVRALLTEELGEGLANEPDFERISSDVWRMLEEDEDTRSLMEEALRRLRGA